MENLLEILKYALPSVLVILITYVMLSNFMNNEEKRRSFLLRRETRKTSMSQKLNAYERLSLFLERITPSSLLVRVPAQNLVVKEYHRLLLQSIRSEFEHNLSQQIYVSDTVWQQVVLAKNATLGIINKLVQECPPDAPASDLSTKVLSHTMEMDRFPTQQALTVLKAELRKEL
ncbi:MAG: hypothetical protein EBT52_02200 [Flavobacteriia bacterium]|nr:hypothetical protein [Flavobacteriia bacterium]